MRLFYFLIICFYVFSLQAEVLLSTETGVGSKPAGLANNVVSSIRDNSALYYNPGRLAFLPIREFTIGLDGLRTESESEFFKNQTGSAPVSRLRFEHIGYMSAVPTSQGGFSWGVMLATPIIFDDAIDFNGSYFINTDKVNINRQYRTNGNLHYLLAGFGIQVAPKLGIGISGGLVTGKQTSLEIFRQDTNGILDPTDPFNLDYTENYKIEYIGYDLRFGLLAQVQENIDLGFRFNLPQFIRAQKQYTTSVPEHYNYKEETGTENTTYATAFKATFGISYTLPMLIASLELRTTTPFDFVFPNQAVSSDNQSTKFKNGVGLALELPIPSTNFILRTGYSIDDLDLHSFSQKIADGIYDLYDNGTIAETRKHILALGLGWQGSENSFDISFNRQNFALNTANRLLNEIAIYQFTMSFATRY